MNADIIKRVVRAIADGSQNDLDQLAKKIVETERRTGHGKLADQLQARAIAQRLDVGRREQPVAQPCDGPAPGRGAGLRDREVPVHSRRGR